MMTFRLSLLALPILLSACASGHPIEVKSVSDSGQFAGAEAVSVLLANFDFAPATVRLRAGRPYVLRIENRAGGSHTFTAPDFFEAASILSTDAPLLQEGEVEVGAGASATIRLIPKAGSYKLVCTHLGHAVLGMTGKIIVD